MPFCLPFRMMSRVNSRGTSSIQSRILMRLLQGIVVTTGTLSTGVLGALICVPARAAAQAQTGMLSLSVAYNTRKALVKPEGALKVRIDSIDAAMLVAQRNSQSGELRRLFAMGTTLLAGREWTPQADYSTSLRLRSDRVVIDPQQPYVLRIEQQYLPSTRVSSSTAVVRLLVPGAARPTSPGDAASTTRELGRFPGVGANLLESPYSLTLDLQDVPDGRYTLVVELRDSMQVVGTTNLPVVVRHGIDAAAARLEAAARSAPASVRDALSADILYPVDRLCNVNRGVLELRMLDVTRDFAAADSIATQAAAGTDPFRSKTGDFKRHYLLNAAGEIMPYHLYVPSNYKAGVATPVIVALHGLGATEDSFFDSYGRKLPELAEAGGYIIAAPLGYRVDGGYGWGLGDAPADSAARRSSALSELDVMQVLEQVRKHYTVDSKRIYLMGHSLGAIGTWKIAAKYPDVWAALGLFSGQGQPSTAHALMGLPQFVVHGDADPTVNVRGSRTMVGALRALNTEVLYIEVPGGNHSNVVQSNLAGMMEFFGKHRKP